MLIEIKQMGGSETTPKNQYQLDVEQLPTDQQEMVSQLVEFLFTTPQDNPAPDQLFFLVQVTVDELSRNRNFLAVNPAFAALLGMTIAHTDIIAE